VAALVSYKSVNLLLLCFDGEFPEIHLLDSEPFDVNDRDTSCQKMARCVLDSRAAVYRYLMRYWKALMEANRRSSYPTIRMVKLSLQSNEPLLGSREMEPHEDFSLGLSVSELVEGNLIQMGYVEESDDQSEEANGFDHDDYDDDDDDGGGGGDRGGDHYGEPEEDDEEDAHEDGYDEEDRGDDHYGEPKEDNEEDAHEDGDDEEDGGVTIMVNLRKTMRKMNMRMVRVGAKVTVMAVI
jgi:hypothetical protein